MSIGPITGLDAAAAAISSLMERESENARSAANGSEGTADGAGETTVAPAAAPTEPAGAGVIPREAGRVDVKA